MDTLRRHASKPIPDLSHGKLVVAMVCFDVRTGEVRVRRLIAVPLFLKNKNYLVRQPTRAVSAASEVQAKFEGHVETIVLALAPRLTPAKIVNGISRRLDEIEYLADARLSGVAAFGGGTRFQAEPHDAEQHSLKNVIVVVV